jgi:probable F420-dependent oxidoreductase
MRLGPYGIWWSGSWRGEDRSVGEVAREMEQLGYSALWSSGRFQPGIHPLFGELLDATDHAVVATGILSVWINDPAAVAAQVNSFGARRERFLLGVGASHAPVVEPTGQRYERPLAKVREFLHGLGTATPAVANDRRIVAALGPKMLRLAAEESLGAHPYFVPVEHTARARELLGPGPVLATEVAVVLDADAERARSAARSHTTGYLGLENYANHLAGLGWPDDELQHGGSDRLVDAIVPHGNAAAVARRLREHLEAGADHVSVQVVREGGRAFPLEEYRALASELF